jgi:hypothetical protein
MLAVHLLGAEQEIIEGQREERFDFGNAPALAGGRACGAAEHVSAWARLRSLSCTLILAVIINYEAF